ncbi:Hpt domain-containing protein [Methylorubrum sp. SB2]|uniref:Hpt domain-containing protein n=1 Tax=Methylorubrum subtropicum TaxID=3138812 RepID=UPI00313F01E7
MSELPLIDRAHLGAQTFGDADLADEVLGLFVAQGRRLMPLIAAVDRPAAERADFAHTLKGAALGVGAARVAAVSAAVEAALRAGEAAPDLAALEAAVADTLAHIEEDGPGSGT